MSKASDPFAGRIGLSEAGVGRLLERAAAAFGLGNAEQFERIDGRFEDFNGKLHTTQDPVFLKVFSRSRTREDIARSIMVIEAALQAGVRASQARYDKTRSSIV